MIHLAKNSHACNSWIRFIFGTDQQPQVLKIPDRSIFLEGQGETRPDITFCYSVETYKARAVRPCADLGLFFTRGCVHQNAHFVTVCKTGDIPICHQTLQQGVRCQVL